MNKQKELPKKLPMHYPYSDGVYEYRCCFGRNIEEHNVEERNRINELIEYLSKEKEGGK